MANASEEAALRVSASSAMLSDKVREYTVLLELADLDTYWTEVLVTKSQAAATDELVRRPERPGARHDHRVVAGASPSRGPPRTRHPGVTFAREHGQERTRTLRWGGGPRHRTPVRVSGRFARRPPGQARAATTRARGLSPSGRAPGHCAATAAPVYCT